jgi:hypothetical protein
MPSTATRNLRLEAQQTGVNAGTWGEHLNSTIALIDGALTGVTKFELRSGVLKLSSLPFQADEARNQFIDVAGTLTGPVILVVPDSSKSYDIRNSTSGPATVTLKTNGGAGIVVPQGRTVAARVIQGVGVTFAGIAVAPATGRIDAHVSIESGTVTATEIDPAYRTAVADDIAAVQADLNTEKTTRGDADTAAELRLTSLETSRAGLAAVATSGNYNDLSGRPALFSGAYADVSGKPTLGTASALDAGTADGNLVRITGGKLPAIDGSQLTNLPSLGGGTQADWSLSSGPGSILNKPALFSGAYADLSGKPTLFSGAYADLSGKPTPFGALTGPVTSGASGGATTITPNAITNAMLAQAPANTVKGNLTGAVANESDVDMPALATALMADPTASGTISGGITLSSPISDRSSSLFLAARPVTPAVSNSISG